MKKPNNFLKYLATLAIFLIYCNLFAQSDERAPKIDRKIINNPPIQQSSPPVILDVLAGFVWYVNDTYIPADDIYTTSTGSNSNPGTSALPFATINHAVSVATAGDTIYVDAGTYTLTSAITVNKKLTFLGRQAGVDARTRGAVPESIVDAINLSGFPSTVFDVKPVASESIIDGFTLQGANGGQGVGRVYGWSKDQTAQLLETTLSRITIPAFSWQTIALQARRSSGRIYFRIIPLQDLPAEPGSMLCSLQ